MFACKNCGGKVVYDPETGKLQCQYCSTQFEIADFDASTADSVSATYESNVYVCSNCGAEITTPDNQSVSFCSYCGSQSVLYSKTEQMVRPQNVVPFRLSRKQMQKTYREKLSNVLYLPKEYTDPQYIDSMRGIYIPFYAHSVSIPSDLKMTLERKVDLNSRQYRIDTLSANVTASHDQQRYYTDASSSLDDTISEMLLPFPESLSVPFNPAYLAGFYADTEDVAPEKYIPNVMEQASDDVIEAVSASLGSEYTVKTDLSGHVEGYPNGIPVSCKSYHTSLFPVWFLTRRDKDRVSYAVANGATGKLYADLPVDGKKFWAVTGVIALVIFLTLCLFASFTAKSSLGWVTLLTAFMMLTYHRQLRKIMEKETHLFDVGYAGYDKNKAASYRKKHKKSGNPGVTITLITVCAIFALSFGAEFNLSGLFAPIAVILSLIQMIGILSCGIKIQDRRMALVGVFSFITVTAAFLILLFNPVSDLWYYGGSILCLAGALLPGVLLIRCYNLIASRPLPSYFRREGGINDAK